MNLQDIFGTSSHLSATQECARAVVVFVYGLLLVRLAGRRVFGKWGALDIVVSVIVGSNLSRTVTGSAELGGTLLATTLLMVLHWVLAQAAAWRPWVSRLVEGASVRVLHRGQLDAQSLLRHCISEADLGEALRGAGLQDLSAAREITLEPSGKLSVLKES